MSIGFVPTMGYLHDGHCSLIRKAKQEHDIVVVSIFVNPSQFAPHEDFERYPRDLDRDVALLGTVPADVVFSPAVEAMYPPGERTRVRVSGLTEGLCGAFRPTHFEGVTTVVAKLFHQVGPCRAYFGRKDFQQLRVIRQMVRDLCLPLEVVGCETVREEDGLAMSSRNAYLGPSERVRARALIEGLRAGEAAVRGGERSAAAVERAVRERVEPAADRIDYVFVGDPESLAGHGGELPAAGPVLLAVAAWVGKTRLIDNLEVDRPGDGSGGGADPGRGGSYGSGS